VPWIHLADEVGLIQWALRNERVRGPLNCTAPEVPRNRAFAMTLGKVLGKPARMPVPGFALRLGLGVVADILIHGRRVVPHKALDLGYQFQFPTLELALRDLLLR
jgi:NAD dependent epimerase/dehydratase family enzyme